MSTLPLQLRCAWIITCLAQIACLGGAYQQAECGSMMRPYSDATCPCRAQAYYLPDASYGEASCRPDQEGRVVGATGFATAVAPGVMSNAEATASGPVLLCTCRDASPSPGSGEDDGVFLERR